MSITQPDVNNPNTADIGLEIEQAKQKMAAMRLGKMTGSRHQQLEGVMSQQ